MRMKRITDRGRLKRWRYALEEPYAYYSDLNNRVEQLEHTVLLNWVYVWLIKRLKPWERLHSFSYEDDYGVLRTDAFAAVKNTVTGEFRFCFVEMDRTTSNRFDKVRLYNDLYESEGYAESWWVSLTRRYPPIIIATTNTRRKRKIEEAVQSDNRNGLEFQVYLVDALRQEVV
ncbi:MAG: hypothetical protein KMY50_00525 [Candidatus Desulforudis sp.]|nr:hypothetical protein [Desulforudis sp.]